MQQSVTSTDDKVRGTVNLIIGFCSVHCCRKPYTELNASEVTSEWRHRWDFCIQFLRFPLWITDSVPAWRALLGRRLQLEIAALASFRADFWRDWLGNPQNTIEENQSATWAVPYPTTFRNLCWGRGQRLLELSNLSLWNHFLFPPEGGTEANWKSFENCTEASSLTKEHPWLLCGTFALKWATTKW